MSLCQTIFIRQMSFGLRMISFTQFGMSSNPEFNNKTTADEVAAVFKERVVGKHFVITGANIGLGKETARVLAKQNGIITICSRNTSKGEEAKKDILKDLPNANITVMQLDLSSLKSIKAFSEQYIKSGKPINVLINNAGVMACPMSLTEDGFENQFGTNHLGHFYLTKLLLPVLQKSATSEPSRVVVLSSIAHVIFSPKEGILFNDLDGSKSYNCWERYGHSKLANILFTVDMQKQFGSDKVAFVALHPGNIQSTNLMQHFGAQSAIQFCCALKFSEAGLLLGGKDIPQGTSTTIVCALDPEIQFGKYYSDCQLCTRLHKLAYDEELARKLTKVSNELIDSKIK
eukprot:NODE_79_length_22985_cov_0.358401.p5 type:complete len:345 gc:universal NODE_79_length_22985_cov_0.358401:10810-9776(-)